MVYKKTKGPKGRSLYFKDGKLVSVKSIPSDILLKLDEQGKYDAEAPPQPIQRPERSCIFDGKPATKQRFVNLQTVYLCEDCYYDKTVGKITERLRLNEKEEVTS